MKFYNELFSRLAESDVISFLKLDMKKNGDGWMGFCPGNHHSQSGESFQISNKKFHCWNCGIGGNLIHLIEFVKFKTISKKNLSDNYKQSRDIGCDIAGLNRFFSLNLSQNEIKASEKEHSETNTIYEILTRTTELMHQNLLKSFEGKLNKKIDLTREAIIQFKIGFCYPSLLVDLKKEYNLQEILLTGLVEKIKNKNKLTLSNRYVFPFVKNGWTVYMSGRVPLSETSKIKYKKIPLYNLEKHPYISIYLKNNIFYNEDILDKSNMIVITEGLTDCIAAVQNGIPAISNTSTNITNTMFEHLLEITKNISDIYICFDSEISEAGIKGAHKIAEMFLKNNKELRIIDLPRDDKTKIDLKDYFKSNTKNDFMNLLNKSKTLIHKMIESLDPALDRFKLKNKIDPILDLISWTDDITINNYLNYILKNLFKLKQSEISVYKIEIKKIQKNRIKQEKKKIEEPKIQQGVGLTCLNQGLDFVNDEIFYTIFDQQLEKYINQDTGERATKFVQVPYLINSKKEYFKATPDELLKRGLFFSKSILPSLGLKNQWATQDGIPFSVMDFITNNTKVNELFLYKKIKSYFDNYIIFPEKNISIHLSILILTSYITMIFDTIGYVHLHAEKRSGKTRALEIVEGLGFGAVMSSSITDASLFRVIESTRCLLITDEAENLDPSTKVQVNNQSEKLQLLNCGYKKSGAAIRIETINNQLMPVKYSTFCIKIFAGIKEINDVLRDRTITHLLKRVQGSGPKEFIPSMFEREWGEIRNQCHIFGMQSAKRISEIYKHEMPLVYKDILDRKGIVSREYEIWIPYLSVAKYIDEQSNSESNIFNDLLELAQITRDYKIQIENDSYTNRLLIMINDFIEENNTEFDEGEMQNYYNLADLSNFIRAHEGFEKFSANMLAKNMYGKLYLCKASEKKRMKKEGQNMRDTYLRITNKSMKEAIERCGITIT